MRPACLKSIGYAYPCEMMCRFVERAETAQMNNAPELCGAQTGHEEESPGVRSDAADSGLP